MTILIASIRYKTTKETIASQKELIEVLQTQVSELRILHENNSKEIAHLTGQLNAYKEIPLSKIADAVAKTEQENTKKFQLLKDIMKVQKEILHTVKEAT